MWPQSSSLFYILQCVMLHTRPFQSWPLGAFPSLKCSLVSGSQQRAEDVSPPKAGPQEWKTLCDIDHSVWSFCACADSSQCGCAGRPGLITSTVWAVISPQTWNLSQRQLPTETDLTFMSHFYYCIKSTWSPSWVRRGERPWGYLFVCSIILLLLDCPEANEGEHSEEQIWPCGTCQPAISCHLRAHLKCRRVLATHAVVAHHLDHSSDLPPSNFVHFTKMKIKLTARRFDTVEEIQHSRQRHTCRGT